MKRLYRDIVPAKVGSRKDPDLSESGPRVAKKRPRTKQACQPCRSLKASCDGKHPDCSRCIDRRVKCSFTASLALPQAVDSGTQTSQAAATNDLEHKARGQDLFLTELQSLPMEEAKDLFHRLRATSDISKLVTSYRGNIHGKQHLSDIEPVQRLLSSLDSENKFEHISSHQGVQSDSSSTCDLSSVQSSSPGELAIPEAHIPEYQTLDAPRKNRQRGIPFDKTPFEDNINQQESEHARPGQIQRHKYCDIRLHDLDISYWTNVSISDEFAGELISSYFETDHSFQGQFDTDLFLRDLVGLESAFCSPFLVNAVLYRACGLYTAMDIRAYALNVPFFNEAERLWKEDRPKDGLMTIAAMATFAAACAFQGQENLARVLSTEVRGMAERMGLLDLDPDSAKAIVLREMTPDWTRASSYVAWGAYNWLSMRGVRHEEAPIQYPPIFEIPGNESIVEANNSAFSWPPHPLPPYIGQTFTKFCQLWVITQEVASVYSVRGGNSPLTTRVSLAFVESKYKKLLTWADNLPPVMARLANRFRHVFLFHIWYHRTVLDIWRPWIVEPENLRLRLLLSADISPQALYAASLKQLKILTMKYQVFYPQAVHATYSNTSLLQLANTSLQGYRS